MNDHYMHITWTNRKRTPSFQATRLLYYKKENKWKKKDLTFYREKVHVRFVFGLQATESFSYIKTKANNLNWRLQKVYLWFPWDFNIQERSGKAALDVISYCLYSGSIDIKWNQEGGGAKVGSLKWSWERFLEHPSKGNLFQNVLIYDRT